MNNWFKDEDERTEHTLMLQSPGTWSSDYIHVKHPERVMDGGGDSSYGKVTYVGTDLYIYRADGTNELYPTAELMIDAGWVVD